jgi:hypothetical protein
LKTEDYFSSHYSIHGLILRFFTNSRHIHAIIQGFLEWFHTRDSQADPDIDFSIFDGRDDAGAGLCVPDGAKLLYASSEKDRFDIREVGLERSDLYLDMDGATIYMDLGGLGCLSFTPTEGRARGLLREPEHLDPNLLSSYIFMFVLARLLNARGFFPVHCSAVEKGGAGIIFPGYSGAGKTTTCIALIRNGFGLLGDDRPILRRGAGGGLEFLAFPEMIDVTEETIGFFPELQEQLVLREGLNLTKKSFFAEDIYPGSIRDSCVPGVILYPEISGSKKSRLESLPKIEALKSFLPHSLLVLDRDISRKHFEILSDLVESADCYRLELGTDLEDLPALVETVL